MTYKPMTKSEMLHRVRNIISRLKSLKTPGVHDVMEVRELEAELDEAEAAMGKVIDDYMSGLYDHSGRSQPTTDINGLSGNWRWNSRRSKTA